MFFLLVCLYCDFFLYALTHMNLKDLHHQQGPPPKWAIKYSSYNQISIQNYVRAAPLYINYLLWNSKMVPFWYCCKFELIVFPLVLGNNLSASRLHCLDQKCYIFHYLVKLHTRKLPGLQHHISPRFHIQRMRG